MKNSLALDPVETRMKSPHGINVLIGAIDMMEQVDFRHFDDSEGAKTFCIATQNALGVSHAKKNDYVVYSTAVGPPFKIPDQLLRCLAIKPNWIYLKAHYATRNINVLCNLKGSTHKITKKGRVRESFILSDKVSVKLIHHTCSALNHKPCANCKKRRAHARCLAGYEFYALCSTQK